MSNDDHTPRGPVVSAQQSLSNENRRDSNFPHEPLTSEQQLAVFCLQRDIDLPPYSMLTETKGGRPAYSCIVTVKGVQFHARNWYTASHQKQAREDAAEVALQTLLREVDSDDGDQGQQDRGTLNSADEVVETARRPLPPFPPPSERPSQIQDMNEQASEPAGEEGDVAKGNTVQNAETLQELLHDESKPRLILRDAFDRKFILPWQQVSTWGVR